MAISYRGASNAAGQSSGTTTTPTTVSITVTLPSGAAAGDRIFIVQCGSNTSGTTPVSWNVLGSKDTVVGSGAVAAASGLRYINIIWRDYDGVWSMPALTLTSAAQNSHWVGAVAITPTAGSVFNTPTISTVGGSFNSATTSYTDTTAASFTTTSGGFLIAGTCLNDNVTGSSGALSQSGATFGTVDERCDGGTATGNDVAGQVHTCPVTTGAAATATFTETLSASSQGETLIVQQTESVYSGPLFGAVGSSTGLALSTTASIPVPSGVSTNDVIVAVVHMEASNVMTTVPSGFVEAADSPVTNAGSTNMYARIYYKRQTSATGAGETTGTYDFVLSTNRWREAVAARFTGVVLSGNPFDVTASAVTTTSTTSIPSISDTTTVDHTRLVYLAMCLAAADFSQATGFVEHFDGSAISFQSAPKVTAGATGTIASTSTVSNQTSAWLGALLPSTPNVITPAGATLTLTGQTPTVTATSQDVQYDATGVGDTENATSTSWSHTLGATATGIIVGVTCSLSSTAATGWTKSATCGGVAMSLLGSQTINNGSDSSQVDLWALTSPPTGAQTIAVSYTLGGNTPYLTGNSVSYNNVASFGTAVKNWGFSSTLDSSAVSSATGNMVVSVFDGWYNFGDVSISAPTGTSRYNLTGTSNTYAPTLIEDSAGSTTVTHQATLSASAFWGAVSTNIVKGSGTTLTPASATLTLTGQTPTVTVSNNQSVSPASASLALTGQTPTVTVSNHQIVTPAGASLALTGQTPTVTVSNHQVVSPAAASLTLTGSTPTVSVSNHQVVSPSGATLTLTGATPVVTATAHNTLTPAAATLTLTGQTPTVTSSNHQVVAPAGASLALTGGTPVVTASDHKIVAPTGASLTLTGSTPVVTASDHQTVTPSGASLTLTGGTPVVTSSGNAAVTPSGATLTLTGHTPVVTATAHQVVSPASATLTLTGQTPTVTATAHKTVSPAGATLALTGSTPTVTASNHQVLEPAGAWLTLHVFHIPTVSVSNHKVVTPASAVLTLTGSVPVVLNPVIIIPQPATLTLTGNTPLVIWSAPVLPPEERRVLASVASRLVVATVPDRTEIPTLSDREESPT